MAAKKRKGDVADPKKKAMKVRGKLSSWDREWGDRLVETQRTTFTGSPDKRVHWDVNTNQWIQGAGPDQQVKRSKKNTKRKASQGKKGTPYNGYMAAPNR